MLWTTREFGWVAARRRLLDRLVDHAAEEEPGRRRAGPRQGRPARSATSPACSRCSRDCRSPTTATCRRTRSRCSTPSTRCCSCCPPWPAWSRPCTFDAERMTAGAAGLRARDRHRRVARPRRACRSARRTRWRAHACAGARRAASSSGTSPTRSSPRSATHLTPAVRTVLSVRGALDSRSAFGGTAPARVREQLAALVGTVDDAAAPGRVRLAAEPPRVLACRPPAPSTTDRRTSSPATCSGAPRGTSAPRRGRRAAHRGRGVRRRGRPGSHACRGPTPRNQVMFGPPGSRSTSTSPTACTGASTSCAGRRARPRPSCCAPARSSRASDLARRAVVATACRAATWRRGPANLAAALGVDGGTSGTDLVARGSRLRLRPGTPVEDAEVATGPRIGISRAADTPWRFCLSGNPCVSGPRRTGG